MKTILISGTTKGIGKELALYYLNNEYIVAGISRGEASFSHENYIHLQGDISIEEDVIGLVKQLKKKTGSIDILINNAALANMNHLLTTPYSVLKKVTDVNFIGTFLMIREVGKQMIKQKSGRIINFTTISAALNLETQSLYAATKSAVESLTRTSAKELSEFNITVNAVGPTPMEIGLIKGIPEEWLNNVIQMQTIKRKGTMEDITHVINFLIDDKASFITGQTIYLGGI
ncbi:MAG: SDR family oxidoreductase [Bacteroidetes bacterium]|nr:SDR family oxidoreductase [Bacteroidota bacterium]